MTGFHWINLIAIMMLLAACSATLAAKSTPTPTPKPTPTAQPTPTPPGGWKLVWSDEFDQPDGSLPDEGKWNYAVGAGGWGNGESEYYTDHRAENASIQHGMLVIKAIKEDYLGQSYTSARLTTQRKGDWVYGRMEVRAKLPEGQGIWPAIWMMPTDSVYGGWPRSGEIDIMELLGHEPSRVYGTLHYGNPHASQGTRYDLAGSRDFSDDFHVFAIEWEPKIIRWYVDDDQYFSVSSWFTSDDEIRPFPAPFDQRFYLLLNVAVGGHWPGEPDQTTKFPQQMTVDYVRIYQK